MNEIQKHWEYSKKQEAYIDELINALINVVDKMFFKTIEVSNGIDFSDSANENKIWRVEYDYRRIKHMNELLTELREELLMVCAFRFMELTI